MKRAMALLFLCSPLMAEGPLFKHQDKYVNQEFQNVYSGIRASTKQRYALLYSSTVFDGSGSSATTTTSYVPTKTTITVTPTRTTSRIEVSWTGCLTTSNGSIADAFATLYRGSTNVFQNDACISGAPGAGSVRTSCAGTAFDLPATTSATTYTIRVRSDAGGTTVYWGADTAACNPTLTVKEWSY